jgi:glycosyltransferase involved in cell wall biosynthesis
MKILYIQSNMHVKNHHSLVNYKNINLFFINIENLDTINLSEFDAVYSPCEPIDISKYLNTKFLFGPHFSVFPEKNQMDIIRGSNVTYIHPSEWAAKVWRDNSICSNIKIQPLPFGVDSEKFCPVKTSVEREKVFIYFKNRNPLELQLVETFLFVKKYDFRIFSYKNKYSEEEYIDYLQNSKFGIWVGGHESQGFALEEALSINVPLLVWSVKSMRQEYGSNYDDIPATTIPYWDERCGEYFHNPTEIQDKFDTFISKIETYKPREYIVENLSMEKCENKLIKLIENI